MIINSTLKGSVIGSPIEHSLSPLLHREALAFLDISGEYERREVRLGELGQFFADHMNYFDYLSITMPLKEEALQLPVEVDSFALKIQSSNTLYRRGESWHKERLAYFARKAKRGPQFFGLSLAGQDCLTVETNVDTRICG